MKINTLHTLFLVEKNKTRADGLAPVKCRLTYLEQRKAFRTGLFLNPKKWDSKLQVVKPPKENKHINMQLSLIKQNVSQAFLFLQGNSADFSVSDIYNQYAGKKSQKTMTILELFSDHNSKVEKLVGKDYVIATLWKFRQAYELLKSFIKHQYGKSDYPFKDLDLKFVQDYEFYLKTEKNLGLATTNKMIQRFRKILRIALAEGHLHKDPFIMYKVKRPKKEIVFLTADELETLEGHRFKQPRLELVRELFVFCCYTGLAFNEMASLEYDCIQPEFDGLDWIKMTRLKTRRQISIPVLPQAKEIIERQTSVKDKVFPKITNQKFNSYLKEIAEITGIDKKLTHHIARKTFASTVLLYNDVPMEIVSELLGHSSIVVTQESYGKVIQKKISETMQNLSAKLNGRLS
jgi:integrase